MVFAQQIFVLFNYWWKHMGLGLAKSVRGLEIGVGLAYAEAVLIRHWLSRCLGPDSLSQDPDLSSAAWAWGVLKVSSQD